MVWENFFVQPTDFELAIFCNGSGGHILISRNSLKSLEREILCLSGFLKHPEEAVCCVEKIPGLGIKQKRV